MNLRSAVILKFLSVLSVRNAYSDLTGALGRPHHVAPSTPAMMSSAQTSHSGRTYPAMSTMVNTLDTVVKATLVSVTIPGMPDMMDILSCVYQIVNLRFFHTGVATNQPRSSL